MTEHPTTAEQIDLDRLRSGDKAAFAQVVELYADRLYNLALKVSGDPFEAEDILQEAFISAYKNISRFEGRSNVGTWLYRITYNTALMRQRKKQPDTVSIDEPVQIDSGDMLPRQFFDWCCIPEKDLLTGEAIEYMGEAIQLLPESLKPVFILRDIEGLSTAEVGDTLDISTAAVKSRLHRARLFLRERLSEYFAERAAA
ncbi:MAG: sigma-70 family RNA polymerase sigma factor [Anaerolineae bacterium]|nr:sigma-70 family RNA polymerase sigma factor [Anaerolineae bacterium]